MEGMPQQPESHSSEKQNIIDLLKAGDPEGIEALKNWCQSQEADIDTIPNEPQNIAERINAQVKYQLDLAVIYRDAGQIDAAKETVEALCMDESNFEQEGGDQLYDRAIALFNELNQ